MCDLEWKICHFHTDFAWNHCNYVKRACKGIGNKELKRNLIPRYAKKCFGAWIFWEHDFTWPFTSVLQFFGKFQCILLELQWLQNESTILGVFWEFLWHKNFVCMICETNLALECAHKSSWPTAFEKSKIHQPNLEKLQFEGSKIEGFLLDF